MLQISYLLVLHKGFHQSSRWLGTWQHRQIWLYSAWTLSYKGKHDIPLMSTSENGNIPYSPPFHKCPNVYIMVIQQCNFHWSLYLIIRQYRCPVNHRWNSLCIQVLNHGQNDDYEGNREDLTPRANEGGEYQRVAGWSEHITMNLLPSIFITEITILKKKECALSLIKCREEDAIPERNIALNLELLSKL